MSQLPGKVLHVQGKLCSTDIHLKYIPIYGTPLSLRKLNFFDHPKNLAFCG